MPEYTDPPLGDAPLDDVDIKEVISHINRPAGPITVGQRHSDRNIAKAIVALMVLVLALIVFTAVVQWMVLRNLDQLCPGGIR